MKNNQNNDILIGLKDVISKIKISKSKIYSLMKNNEFPLPVKIGSRSLWSLESIQTYINMCKSNVR